MSGKSKSSKTNETWQQKLINKVFVKPWPYWVGGILLGLANIIYIWLTGKHWAITTGFVRWGAWLLEQVGVSVQQWEVWNYYDYIRPLEDRYTWSNLGIIVGAWLGILLSQQFKWKQVKNKQQILLALGGGWLMGYGARVASGCNIGGLYTAIASLALNGWVYFPFMILGIWLGSKALHRWLV